MRAKILNPNDAAPLLEALARKKVEEVWTLALNSQMEVLGVQATFRGTRDQCLFHPREPLVYALRKRATHLLLAHNHPCGCPLPSAADIAMTQRMIFLGDVLQIPLIDHIIMTPHRGLYSFRSSQKNLFVRSTAQKNSDFRRAFDHYRAASPPESR